jgi:hypothetical protein
MEQVMKEMQEQMRSRAENRKEATFSVSSKDVKVTKESKQGELDKTFVEVPVQGVNKDRDGDKISEKGQEKLIKQLQTGNGIPAFPNHGIGDHTAMYDFRDIMGAWTDG